MDGELGEISQNSNEAEEKNNSMEVEDEKPRPTDTENLTTPSLVSDVEMSEHHTLEAPRLQNTDVPMAVEDPILKTYEDYPCPQLGIAPSEEQLIIMNDYDRGYNVNVCSVAGSGKSTLLLECCRIAYKESRQVLLLTYNRSLCDKTKARVKALQLNNVEVHTFHSVINFLKGCPMVRNDTELFSFFACGFENDPTVKKNISSFSSIFVDECQDMSENYYKVLKMIVSNRQDSQLMMVGDPRQCINEFVGANVEYFNKSEIYFGNNLRWKYRSMTTSYRLTPLTAQFVDQTMRTSDKQKRNIRGGNLKSENLKPFYISDLFWGKITTMLEWLLKKYKPCEIAVLANSIDNSRHPANLFLTGKYTKSILLKRGVLVAKRSGKAEKTSDQLKYESDKIVLSTFNSFKGDERKAVIVFADSSYTEFHEKDSPKDDIPNKIYVAFTRASELLIIMQSKLKSPINPLNEKMIRHHCTLGNRKLGTFPKLTKGVDDAFHINKTRLTCPVDIIMYRDVVTTIKLLSLLEITGMERTNSYGMKENNYVTYCTNRKVGESNYCCIQSKVLVGHYYGILATILCEVKRKNMYDSVYSLLNDYIVQYFDYRTKDKKKILYRKFVSRVSKKYFRDREDQSAEATMDKLGGMEKTKLIVNSFFEDPLPSQTDFQVESKVEKIEKEIKSNFKLDFDHVTKLVVLVEIYMRELYNYKALKNCKWIDHEAVNSLVGILSDYLGKEADESYEMLLSAQLNHPLLSRISDIPEDWIPSSQDGTYTCKVTTSLSRKEAEENSLGIDEKGILKTKEPWKYDNSLFEVVGRCDIVKNDKIIEVKIANEDSDSHKLQLGCYLAMSQYDRGSVINLSTGNVTNIKIKDKKEYLRTLSRNTKNWEILDWKTK